MNIASTTVAAILTAGAGKANWMTHTVTTIQESIRSGRSDESAATANNVVETVSATSIGSWPCSGSADGPPPAA